MKKTLLLFYSLPFLFASCSSKKGEIPQMDCVVKTNITTFSVQVLDDSFFPATMVIVTGDTVKWNWSGIHPHTTTCDGTSGTTLPAGGTTWDSGIITGSGVFKKQITVPGTYKYICIVHGISMAGTIIANPRCN